MTVALVWRAPRYGHRHALPAGHARALCGRAAKPSWLDEDESTGQDRCVDCARIAAWPPDQLAGRIAALPPPAHPRDRYLRTMGVIP